MRQSIRQVSPSRLRLRANPVRLLLSASPWLSAGYLLSYLLASGLLFAIVVTACVTTAFLSITIALVPLLIAAAAVVRGCAEAERFLLRQVVATPVRGDYPPPQGPPPQGPGLWRQARARWSSGATWRDIAYLAGLWPFLYALDTAIFTIWAVLAAGIALPLWYSHVADVCLGACDGQHVPGVQFGHYPNGPHGAGASGWYVDSIGPALLVAACCLVAFLLWNYVLVLTARTHGTVAAAVLGRHPDPLGPARQVLAGPGPLGPLVLPPGKS